MTSPNSDDKVAPETPVQYSAADLRNARRKARKMGLNPKNGLDAVKMLEEKGVQIDATPPSLTDGARPPLTETAAIDALTTSPKGQISPQLPMVSAKNPNMPAAQKGDPNVPAVISKEERQKEIKKLEQKMKKRRKSRLVQMIRRFSMYVLFPTLLTIIYLNKYATPLYQSKSIITIQEATTSTGTGIGDFLKNSPFAGGNSASIKLQLYMQSPDAFLRLENDFDLPAVFMKESVGRFERIEKDASQQKRYKTFKKYVKSIFDSTDQILRIEVKAPDPETTVIVSNLLIKYAEEQLDRETEKVRGDGLEKAAAALQSAEDKLTLAQKDLIELQSQQTNLDPVAEVQVVTGIISQQRGLLNEKEIALEQIMRNAQPNKSRVNALENDIAAIKAKIEELNAGALGQDRQGESLAQIRQQIIAAESNVTSRLQGLELQRAIYQGAAAEVNEKRKYLTLAVPPEASFEPLFPKKVPTALMVFVVFFGLYLFISMTIEVIREQVSV